MGSPEQPSPVLPKFHSKSREPLGRIAQGSFWRVLQVNVTKITPSPPLVTQSWRLCCCLPLKGVGGLLHELGGSNPQFLNHWLRRYAWPLDNISNVLQPFLPINPNCGIGTIWRECCFHRKDPFSPCTKGYRQVS